jgi:hypothetical protein
MTVKEQLLQEIDRMPETNLQKVLEFALSLQSERQPSIDEEVWQAYLESKREREEVYRRLANS